MRLLSTITKVLLGLFFVIFLVSQAKADGVIANQTISFSNSTNSTIRFEQNTRVTNAVTFMILTAVINPRFNGSEQRATTYTSINQSFNGNIRFVNVSASLIYLSNRSVLCTDILSCNGEFNMTQLPPNMSITLIQNFTINESFQVDTYNPIKFLNNDNTTKYLASRVYQTLRNVPVQVFVNNCSIDSISSYPVNGTEDPTIIPSFSCANNILTFTLPSIYTSITNNTNPDFDDECNPPSGTDWYIDNKNCIWTTNKYNPDNDIYILNGYNLTITNNATFTVRKIYQDTTRHSYVNVQRGSYLNYMHMVSYGACGDYQIVPLADFDLSTCTRKRASLLNSTIRPLPAVGIHSAGTANNSGAQINRNIQQWYNWQSNETTYDFSSLDSTINTFVSKNMTFLLTLRPDHPNMSSVSFDTSGAGSIDNIDSYPKNITVWTNAVTTLVSRYYNNATVRPYFGGVQIGNEWYHQFETNASYNYGPSLNGSLTAQAIDLMNQSYLAIKAVNQTIPVMSFGITGVKSAAMHANFYQGQESFYQNTYYGSAGRVNVDILSLGDTSNTSLGVLQLLTIQSANYYDYLDFHMYYQEADEPRFVANLVRTIWNDNGITGKGLSCTECGPLFYNYSYDYAAYNVQRTITTAIHAGIDTFFLSSQNAGAAFNQNYEQITLTNFNNGTEFNEEIGNNFTIIVGYARDSVNITKNGTSFLYKRANGVNFTYDYSLNVPPYPSLFQCFDGLDNNKNGLIDSADPGCSNSSTTCLGNPVQNISIGIYDPCGFSEDRWIFVT